MTLPEKTVIVSDSIIIVSHNTGLIQELVKNLACFGYTIKIIHTLIELESELKLGLKSETKLSPKHPLLIIIDKTIFPHGTIQKLDYQIPWVIISADECLDTRLAAVRAGASAFFVPPIDFTPFIEKIEALSTPAAEHAPFKVFVIEDSRTQASLIKNTLTAAGMIVEIMDPKIDLNQNLDKFSPELILMDLYMPNYSGTELASVIRQQEKYVSTPIVFLSSEENMSKQLSAMCLGGDDFLTKPIEDAHLILAISSRIIRARSIKSKMIQDSLTGLLNHTRILDQLNSEILRSQREKTPLCFAMIDLDHFKKINDAYGHLTGDQIIKNIARLLKQRLRRTDSIGRYGGEEFALIFPNTTIEALYELLSVIKNRFEQLKHPVYGQDLTINLTFSAGIVALAEPWTLSESWNSVNDIIQAADRALYQAKAQGRNKIIIAKPGTTSS